MRIEQLNYLITLKEKGSINAAAEELYISHQALGKSIRCMEKELGVEILDRTTRVNLFTPQGDEIIESAKKILKEYSKLLSKLEQDSKDKSSLSGKLQIYSSFVISISILPNSIQNFRDNVPQVYITHENSGCRKLFKTVENIEEKSDFIGVVSFPEENLEFVLNECKKNGLAFYKLRESELEFYCSKKSIFANMKKVSAKRIFEFPTIRFTDTSDFHAHKQGVHDMATTSYDVFLNSVAEGKGIGCLCDISKMRNSRFYHDSDLLVKIDVEDKITYYIGYIINEKPSECVKEFVKYLEKELKS